MGSAAEDVAVAGNAPEARPVFRRGGLKIAAVVMVNALFEALSLGLYRFWARTRLRRFLWNHVAFDGSPLEYSGTGRELFGAFAAAVSLALIPGAAIFFLAIVLIGPGALFGPADLAFTLLLLPLVPVALYRARGYRLSRTLWRGISFGQDGSSLTYALIWLGHGVLAVLTLGLSVPWRNVAVQRYRVNHSMYGGSRFRFTGRGGDLLVAWLGPWLATVTAIVALSMTQFGLIPGPGGAPVPGLQISGWLPLALMAALLLFIRYRTYEFRYFVAQTGLDETRFRSHLSSPVVLGLVLPHLAFAAVLIAVALGGVTAELSAAATSGHEAFLMPQQAVLAAVVLSIVIVLTVLVSLSYNLLLRFALLRAVCRTLVVENPGNLALVPPRPRRRPRRGEGMAELFDMGAM